MTADRIEVGGFAALAAAAQVGTRKAAPTRATDFAFEGTERTVLLELGTLALMRRAGTVGVPASGLPAAPPETLRIADVAEALEEALDESMPAALEWAAEAARRGFVAPPATVSRLVPLAKRYPELRSVLGQRGRWLAALTGVDLDDPAAEPPKKEDWDTLEPKARVALVDESPDDLELFTKALADRRKEVREAAAERLIRMPDSPQAQELGRMALAAVAVRKGFLKTTLEVAPPDPESLPKWLPRSPSGPAMGPGALALYDLVRHVPPGVWGRSGSELLGWAERTDYAKALVRGWGEAARRFGDQGWIDDFMERGGLTDRVPFASQASEAVFDRVAIAALKGSGRGVTMASGLLHERRKPFSPELSRALVDAARAGFDYPAVFVPYGARLHPSTLPSLDEPWGQAGTEPASPDRWESVRLEWRKVLDLRRRLHESLR